MDNQMDSQSQDSGSPIQFMTEVGKGLDTVLSMFQKGGAPEDVVAKMQEISQGYNSLISQLSGQETAAPEAPKEPPTGGSVSPVV